MQETAPVSLPEPARIGRAELAPKPDPLVIFHSGFLGGGPGLDGFRDALATAYGADNSMVISAATTREAFPEGTQNLTEHYQRVAADIIAKAQDRDIVYTTHSLGGIEVIDVVKAMLEQGYKGNMDIVFLNNPGFEKRMFGVGRFLVDWLKMMKNRVANNQHAVYPLPERYYENRPRLGKSEGVDVVIEDSAEARKLRRDRFTGHWLEQLVADPARREEIRQSLDDVDGRIDRALASSDPKLADDIVKASIKKRLKILNPLIEGVFKSEFLAPETRQQLTEQFGDTPDQLVSKSRFVALGMVHMGRVLNKMHRNMSREMTEVVALADENHANLRFSLVTAEHDPIVPSSKASKIKRWLSRYELTDHLAGIAAFEGFGHDLGVRPEAIPQAVAAVKTA